MVFNSGKEIIHYLCGGRIAKSVLSDINTEAQMSDSIYDPKTTLKSHFLRENDMILSYIRDFITTVITLRYQNL